MRAMSEKQIPTIPAKVIRILIKRGYLKKAQIFDRKAVKAAFDQCFADMFFTAKERGWHEEIIAAIGPPPSCEPPAPFDDEIPF
jgi:hypothetical protein